MDKAMTWDFSGVRSTAAGSHGAGLFPASYWHFTRLPRHGLALFQGLCSTDVFFSFVQCVHISLFLFLILTQLFFPGLVLLSFLVLFGFQV
jgi:hypothetical protein